MELYINNWMEWDLVNANYHVVYVVSENDWYILTSGDDFNEMHEELFLQSQDGGEGQYWLINYLGEKIKQT